MDVNATTTTRGVTVTYDSVLVYLLPMELLLLVLHLISPLATGMDFGLPVGTPMQLLRLLRCCDGGTVNLNGSYIGYVLGTFSH